MHPTPLIEDLKLMAAASSSLDAIVGRIAASDADFAQRAPQLVALGLQAGHGLFRTLALLLKAQWEAEYVESSPWSPWRAPQRLRDTLGDLAAELPASAFELLVLEQCAWSCHLIAHAATRDLEQRFATEQSLLEAAPAPDRDAYLADKRTWLLDEHQYDWLLLLRQRLVGELESTRMRYLAALGETLIEYVEAAHRLALMRYRTALDDPALTSADLGALLQQDLLDTRAGAGVAPLEPDLRQALLDTVHGVQAELASLGRLGSLWSHGTATPASENDRRAAALLFRRLARLIHPDVLQHHPHYADLTPANRERLIEIWHQASATHGARTFLSQDKLINYVEHLQEWIGEAQRILDHPAFHAPLRLLVGATLAARHADLQRAMVDVQRHLRAVRDDIAQLEFDPRHDEYRRVIAMSEAALAQERTRMAARSQAWNDEAQRLAAELARRHAAAGLRHPEH